MAKLRTQSGVKSVSAAGYRRHALTVSGPYDTNDPEYNGWGPGAPYYESATDEGQWDMHAIQLGYAFEYSQPSNGSGLMAPNALGSSSVTIAMVDTGQDTTHPELSGKFARQACFVTNPNNVQSTSAFTTDEDGHGTDTAGIAAENTNNNFGFTAAGGNVRLLGYRVFPTPDDSCASDNSSDNQCSSNTADIASAIEDAVNNGASVISISLGGDGCNPAGVDQDPVEGAAIADAIAANVVVVAAAGNDGLLGQPPAALEAPACDSGVIAAGASALSDGQPNGTYSSGGPGTALAPAEYVAYYSNVGTPGASPNSASAWGIVAPGGDPTSDMDADFLHWIDNIWTTTPFQLNSQDNSFVGLCTDDGSLSATTPPVDCRTLIAGTSMATPHIAGAAALIISVNAAYKSPTAMKQLLCTTADDISDPNEGCGRLNVYRAMATALHDPTLP